MNEVEDAVAGPQDVAAATAEELVVASAASERVVPRASLQVVATRLPEQPVVAASAEDEVVPRAGVDRVATAPAADDVVPRAPAKDVAPFVPEIVHGEPSGGWSPAAGGGDGAGGVAEQFRVEVDPGRVNRATMHSRSLTSTLHVA